MDIGNEIPKRDRKQRSAARLALGITMKFQ